MTTAMTRFWAYHRDEIYKKAQRTYEPTKRDTWVDPPPIKERVAEYLFTVMTIFLRQQKAFPSKRARPLGHTRMGSFPDFETIDMRGAKDSFQATYRTLFPFVPAFSAGRSSLGPAIEEEGLNDYPASAFEMSATSFHLSNSPATIEWLIHLYSCRVIFYLSASNWPVVFAKIHSKLLDIVDPAKGEEEDMTEVRLIAACSMDRERLLGLLRGLPSIYQVFTMNPSFFVHF